MDQAGARRVPWEGAALAAAFAFALVLPACDNFDIWWHLRTGQYILEQRQVPRADMYSFVARGTRWVNPSWLADVGLFCLWRVGDAAALRALTALAFALAVGLAMFATPRHEPLGWPAVAAGLGCAYAVWQSALMRPLVFSLPLTALFLWVLRGRRDRWLWSLPLLTALWANVHAGFAAGLILLFIAFCDEALAQCRAGFRSLGRLRALLLVGVVSGLACLANPFGLGVLTYPFRLTGSSEFMSKVQEWLPPTSDQAFWPYWAWTCLLAACVLVSVRRVALFDLLAVVVFGWLSMSARRQVGVFGLVSLPVMSKHLGIAASWLGPRTVASAAARRRLAVAGKLALVGVAALASVAHWRGREPDRLPAKAVAFVESLPFEGEILNEYDWGGYLIWRLFPKRRVFIDGRCLVYGDAGYLEWERIYLCKRGWEDAAAKRNVQCMILRHRRPARPDGTPMPLPFTSPNWRTVYWDDDSVVLLKRTPAHERLIAKHDWSLTNPAIAASLLGRGLRVREIEEQLTRKIAADPACARAHENLALCCLARKDFAAAAAALERSVHLRPKRAAAWYNLGYAKSKLGQLDAAQRHCERAIRLDSEQPYYFLKLGDICEQRGELSRAARALRRVVALVGTEKTPKLQQRIRRLEQASREER